MVIDTSLSWSQSCTRWYFGRVKHRPFIKYEFKQQYLSVLICIQTNNYPHKHTLIWWGRHTQKDWKRERDRGKEKEQQKKRKTARELPINSYRSKYPNLLKHEDFFSQCSLIPNFWIRLQRPQLGNWEKRKRFLLRHLGVETRWRSSLQRPMANKEERHSFQHPVVKM